MLINDADWELLVSASGDIPPPTPALTALVAKPWAFHHAQRGGLGNPPSHSSPQTEALPVSHRE